VHRLFMITIPGLEVKADWPPVRDRLLDEFPAITDVLATTLPETVLIVYEGSAEVDAWLEGVDQALAFRRRRPTTLPPHRSGTGDGIARVPLRACVPVQRDAGNARS
jgi:hypothetical protein